MGQQGASGIYQFTFGDASLTFPSTTLNQNEVIGYIDIALASGLAAGTNVLNGFVVNAVANNSPMDTRVGQLTVVQPGGSISTPGGGITGGGVTIGSGTGTPITGGVVLPSTTTTITNEPQTNVTLFTSGGAVKTNATENVYFPDYQVQPGATGGIELRAGTNMNIQLMDLFVTFPSQNMTITSYQIPTGSPLAGLSILPNPTQTAGRYRLTFVNPNRTTATDYSFTARTINDNDVLVRLGVSINANAVVSNTPLSVSLARGNGATIESIYVDGVTQNQVIPTVNAGVITVTSSQAQVGGACQTNADCNGNGNCVNVTSTNPGVCACNIGYQGDLYCQSCSTGYVDNGLGICVPQLPNFCDQNTCQNSGVCNRAAGNASTIYAGGACECPLGYTGTFCQQCAAGYSGYPNCTFDRFANLRNLTITLNRAEVSRLSLSENEQWMGNVVVMIHSTAAEGHTFTIEGRQITLPSVPGSTPGSIAAQLVASINDPNFLLSGMVQATLNSTIPGALIIRQLPQGNPNRFVDISTSAPESVVSVFPSSLQSLTLQADDSVGLVVIGEMADGSTQVLNPQAVTWQAQPVNRVDDAALNGGRLERGDVDGNSTVFAQITQSGGNIIASNSLSVLVERAPVVEFARRIGSNPIERGGRIQLSVRITDLTQIADIAQITSSIVRSRYSLYADIQNDPSAVYFSMSPFDLSSLQAINTTAQAGQSAAQFFRTFTIPIDIPQDARLTDGNYQLILSITNSNGFTTNVVVPITIGALASGDVDGNGRLTMLDVILAFQIANGQIVPTTAQTQAANIDGRGNVTLLDVILLFNQVNNP
ncbi:hypothetical protein IPJ72_05910 [Candidatus Peregrinibacteria bacterium]|nr:MAG: hypothetical protein IPJ72_05910 [Candidatus Peregrinibacteria bacterium]